jgi:hypothetical protein
MLDDNRWVNALRYSWVAGMHSAQERKNRKLAKKVTVMSETKDPWTDDEFCAELGRAWLKIYKAQTGKDHPMGPSSMYTTEQGLAFLGKNYRDKVQKANNVNLSNDYGMLSMMARSQLRQKYHLEG